MSDRAIRRLLFRTVPAAYEPLILSMRFYVEPEISCSRFFGNACLTDAGMHAYRQADAAPEKTELGIFITDHLRGGLFVDIPCGLHAARDQAEDIAIAPLAAALGARNVWEIDITADVMRDRITQTIDVTDGGRRYMLGNGIGEIGLRNAGNATVAAMQDDLLGFIAKMPDGDHHDPQALYLSGIQPDAALCAQQYAQADIIVPYLVSLYDELQRVSAPGDLVILNSSAMLVAGIDEIAFPFVHPAVALLQRGFILKRRCALDKVHVFFRE